MSPAKLNCLTEQIVWGLRERERGKGRETERLCSKWAGSEGMGYGVGWPTGRAGSINLWHSFRNQSLVMAASKWEFAVTTVRSEIYVNASM